MIRARVHELVDRVVRVATGGQDARTIAQLKDDLAELSVGAGAVAQREAKVREACDIWEAGDGWQSRADVEIFMRDALGLEPAEWPGELCEGDDADNGKPCGLVKHHDFEGVPLCTVCFEDLINESVDEHRDPAAQEAQLERAAAVDPEDECP